MVRRHKPSLWQAGPWQFNKQIQDEVKKCYPPRVMKQIIKAARLEKIESDPVKQAQLAKIIEHNIISLAPWAINWLKLSDRPSAAQRKAALKRVEKAANTLTNILQTLDGDSTDDLRWAIMSESESRQILVTDPQFDTPHRLQGYAKINLLKNIISKLEQWAKTAQEQTVIPKDGDKPADVKRWFAEGLIDIWIKIGYKKPTITWYNDYRSPKATGALMEFTNAAAHPLGLEPMEAALRQAIEQWKKKGPEAPHKTPLYR